MNTIVTSGHILLSNNRLEGRKGRAEEVDIKEGAEATMFRESILSYCLLLLVLSSGAVGGRCWTFLVL